MKKDKSKKTPSVKRENVLYINFARYSGSKIKPSDRASELYKYYQEMSRQQRKLDRMFFMTVGIALFVGFLAILWRFLG